MKKLITLCLFAFAMLLGTQSVMAQSNKIEVNAKAAEHTEALRKYIKFNDAQRDKVYLAVQEYEQAKLDLKKIKTPDSGVVEKIDNLLNTKMKDILTDEQFERYQSYSEQ